MPRGRHGKGARGKEAVASGKKKERAVRQALRRERAGGAYLKPSDPDFRSFSTQLAAQGLRLKDVPGDGNCLFRALSEQMRDRLVSHNTLRRDVIDYMRQHREQFEPFVVDGESYEDYLSLLSTEGEYAGNDVIVAFTRAFSTHVVIHQLNTPRWEILAPPTATPTSSERPTLHIAYLNGDHYCSVQPIHPQHSRPSATSQPQTGTRPKGASGRGGVTAAGREGRGEGGEGGEGRGEGGGTQGQLQRVATATGCQDLDLVEQVLAENTFDEDLATVELLQLMCLEEDTSVCGGAVGCDVVHNETLKQDKKTRKTCQPLPHKGHLSNRERKAKAKAERKERRREEQAGGKRTDDSSKFDP